MYGWIQRRQGVNFGKPDSFSNHALNARTPSCEFQIISMMS
jgi:hypothetical protein